MANANTKMGKRGTVVIPKSLRDRLGLDEGTLLVLEELDGGIVIRPAVAIAVEIYSNERKAALLLNNAVDATDYARIRKVVKHMGLDPDAIPHNPPHNPPHDPPSTPPNGSRPGPGIE
jgi:AbrB family looped-hinge helix DNA binding protein